LSSRRLIGGRSTTWNAFSLVTATLVKTWLRF